MAEEIAVWKDQKAKKIAKKALSPFEVKTVKKREGRIKKVAIKTDGGVYVNDQKLPEAFIARNEKEARDVIEEIKKEV